MFIRQDDLRGQEIEILLMLHLEHMAGQSPPDSIHALDLDALRAPEITFWTAWDGQVLLGCGALKHLDSDHGEIKSMHIAKAHRGKGVARRMLSHILQEALGRGYRRLSLETGSGEGFEPAHALYGRHGFQACGPFADYVLDPYSVFMTLELEPDTTALGKTG